ncbi:MAG: NACHT domain-containing protein, partial [Anaerolineae bacterium]|nr:NACHT domain-containing protein [Anaerolineae bacterium]
MNRWVRLVLLALILLVLGLTARGWLPPLLAFLDANTDRLQGLEALAQLGLLALSGLVAFFGWRAWRDRRSDAAPITANAQNRGQAIAQGDGAGKVAVTGGVGGNVTNVTVAVLDPAQLERLLGRLLPTRAPADLREQTQAYLEHVVASYRYLDFRGMGMGDRVALRLPLLEMYVPLKARVERPQGETWARDLRLAGRRPTAEEAEAMGERLSEPTPVLDLLQRHDGLVVLGDPGAGKTTFLKYVALHLALGREADLGLSPRLPVLAPLSAYANALAVRDTPLDRFIADYYRERGIDLPLADMLAQALAAGRAMLLLDGLDEVKDLGRRRDVVDRVADFFTVQRQRGNKFILTSRIVGYNQVRRPIEGLTECTLVDFDDADIALFIEKWTLAIERAVQGAEQVAALSAERERTELLAAVQRNPGVRRLAANPLLLTVLALMKRQGVRLPERRVELYEQYVDILVQHWNLARGLGRAPAYSPDVKQVRKVLAPLALWMHETSPGIGLVKEPAMRRKLAEIYAAAQVDDPERASDRFLADVRDHANLLVERGSRQYGFIHLTFQEYLAAVALAQQGQQSVEPVTAALAAHVGDDNWREVSLLTVGYLGVVQDRPEAASAVLSALVAKRPGPPGAAVVLAGQALLDVGDVGVTPACRAEVIKALQAAMTDRNLPAGQRLAAGLALADLNVLPADLDELVAAPDWGFAI